MNGLKIIDEYISPEKEQELVSKIALSRSIRGEGRNSIKRYGSRLPYNTFVKSNDVPDFLQSLCRGLVEDGFAEEMPDSVTINEYRKGQGIKYHLDSKESGPIITVLSLLGDATMGLKKGKEEHLFQIKRRALIIMSGEARWEWKHCILPVKTDRISIVFRKGTKI